MRARIRYSLISPRAPRRWAGLLAGLVLATLAVSGVMLAGIIATVTTHAAAQVLVTLAGAA